ncbi:MAG: roadblock/LC7 domain-containing protein [Methylococcaceae bacterium]|nr:roadblock/LC7 domain-containing protein [Methylococcaceae bacterium]MDD1615898.1 roadblock/LC7 domain-containing protein [Methylococcaceae bacterium]OYV19136.1 MAG: roadblock/lC7 family protein [Methylococcaceae bacterium NSP1-2]
MYKNILLHLNDLDNSSVDIEASVLVSIDGLVIAATLPHHVDSDDVGAICASAFLLGKQTSEKCASGVLNQVLIKCTKHQIVLIHVGAEAILAVIIKPYANLEPLFSSLQHSVRKITMII